MRVAVVIVNWNARQEVLDCLTSIFDHTKGVEVEVVVVDNNSSDGSVEAIREKFAERVRVIANHDNRGFNAANNQGIAATSAPYICFLNPDTLLHNDALTILMRYMEEHPMVGAVGPKIVNRDGSIQYTAARRVPNWRLEFNAGHLLSKAFPHSRFFEDDTMNTWDHKDSRAVEALSGAAMLFPRAILTKTGPLDEGYFLYADDLDFCVQIARTGATLYYNTDAVVQHLGGRSTDRIPVKRTVIEVRSKIRFYRKNKGIAAVLLYLPTAAVLIIRRAIRETFRGKPKVSA